MAGGSRSDAQIAAQDHGVQDGHTSSAVPGDAPVSAGSGAPRRSAASVEDAANAATLLECGHLAEPWAGLGWGDPVFGSTRECARCAREKGEGYRWQRVVARDAALVESEAGRG